MERPESLTLILKAAKNTMTIEFNFGEEKPSSKKDEKIGRIAKQFSRLSPEKQEEVLKFLDYLERKTGEETGQDPAT